MIWQLSETQRTMKINEEKAKKCYNNIIKYFNDAGVIYTGNNSNTCVRLCGDFILIRFGYCANASLFLELFLYLNEAGCEMYTHTVFEELDIDVGMLDEFYNDDSLFQLSTVFDLRGLIDIYTKFNSLKTLTDDLKSLRDVVYYEHL